MTDITRTLNEIEIDINFHRNNVARSLWELGKDLTEAKGLLPHGAWGKWLKEKAQFSQSSAENFMRIFREVPENDYMLNMGTTKVLALLDAPKEQREQLLSSGEADSLSAAQIRQLTRDKERLEKELAEERNRPPERVTVKPADYETLKAANERLTGMHEKMANAVAEAENRADEAEKYADEMEERVSQLQRELRQAEAAADSGVLDCGMSTGRFLGATRAMLAELVTAPRMGAWLSKLTAGEASEMKASVCTVLSWGQEMLRAIDGRDVEAGAYDG